MVLISGESLQNPTAFHQTALPAALWDSGGRQKPHRDGLPETSQDTGCSQVYVYKVSDPDACTATSPCLAASALSLRGHRRQLLREEGPRVEGAPLPLGRSTHHSTCFLLQRESQATGGQGGGGRAGAGHHGSSSTCFLMSCLLGLPTPATTTGGVPLRSLGGRGSPGNPRNRQNACGSAPFRSPAGSPLEPSDGAEGGGGEGPGVGMSVALPRTLPKSRECSCLHRGPLSQARSASCPRVSARTLRLSGCKAPKAAGWGSVPASLPGFPCRDSFPHVCT